MMKVLFVSSGSTGKISPIIKNQGDSLLKAGAQIDYSLINNKGLFGYIRHIQKLRLTMSSGGYNIIHAHYALSGFVATLAGCKPLVVSLMGSDIYEIKWIRILINIFNWLSWDECIIKSAKMKHKLLLSKPQIIPNGVDFKRFDQIPINEARDRVGFDKKSKHVLFIGNTKKKEKNYPLAENAIKILNDQSVNFRALSNVPNQEIPYYMNAADCLLLTSLWEGSPNIIKEAMACNCPIVATDVGDVREVIADTEGCYLCSFEPQDVAEKLKQALVFGKRTNGREKIKHLDSRLVAQRIISVYKKVLQSD